MQSATTCLPPKSSSLQSDNNGRFFTVLLLYSFCIFMYSAIKPVYYYSKQTLWETGCQTALSITNKTLETMK